MKTWAQRIDEAEQRDEFTEDDLELAGHWVTCACGEQDPRIPRGDIGKPLDEKLSKLGQEFFECIIMDITPSGCDEDNPPSQYVAARHVLAKIEQRAAEVLAGLK